MQLLVIDDEPMVQEAFKVFFEDKNYQVLIAETGAKGVEIALRDFPDIILLDLKLPDIYGLDVLKKIKEKNPDAIVHIVTGVGEIKEAIEAIKSGAENYFQKPVDIDELGIIIDKSSEIVRLKHERKLSKGNPFPIIGRSRAVQSLIYVINLMAENHSTTLLIQGETGTGKELVARNIHLLSKRKNNPFVDINCASIPDNILESELFGHEAGAFTDAKSSKKGLLEIADKGTLFLDEIGDMPPGIQAKLLRVIETKIFRRLGGTRDIKVDIRIIAATNKNLAEAVSKNEFREDLFYRLNVVPVTIPPLRERPEDIPLLAEFFLSEISKNMNKKISSLEKNAMASLASYNWPGNIRELRNVLERAVILCSGGMITSAHLMLLSASSDMLPKAPENLTLKDIERRHIMVVLESVSNNKTKAAQALGISRSTLNEKIKAYNLA